MGIRRRSLLAASTSIVLGTLLNGCSRTSQKLQVRVLKGSVPPQLIGAFKRSADNLSNSQFTADSQVVKLFELLQLWQYPDRFFTPTPWPFSNTTTVFDLVTLNDGWLTAAIQQKLLTPLNTQAWPHWEYLPPKWRTLVQRNASGMLDRNGPVWGAPYRWGTTVIAYRRDRLEPLDLEPIDWADLWRPELQGKISLLDHPREVIGLTLKRLGYSYNIQNPNVIPGLKTALRQLQKQVKVYSSTSYLQPLLLGDTWLAVGWSTDLLPLLTYDRKINIVVPKSGTALWANLWVRPHKSDAQHSKLIDTWIDFCWQSEIALKFAELGDAPSPVNPQQLDPAIIEKLQYRDVLFPAPEILNKSEFIQPLPAEMQDNYQELWVRMRNEQL